VQLHEIDALLVEDDKQESVKNKERAATHAMQVCFLALAVSIQGDALGSTESKPLKFVKSLNNHAQLRTRSSLLDTLVVTG
jgi:hypothetical protein